MFDGSSGPNTTPGARQETLLSTANVASNAGQLSSAGQEPQTGSHGMTSRLRIYAVMGPFMVLLLLWVYLFCGEGAFNGGPSGKAFGADYTMFVSAAQVLKAGGDPYNPRVLLRAETAMMQRLHRTMIAKDQRSQVRVGNPPLLYWAMRPLIGASYVPAALVALISLYVLSGVGFLAILRYFGWKRPFLPTLIFLLMPQVVLGAFYGNVIGIVFAAIGVSLLLSQRYPILAGVLMSLAWLKPPVALPVVLLLGLFHVQRRTAFASGFAAGTAALLALTVGTSGWRSVGLWLHGLVRYSNDMAHQPDVISLAGLYVRWMPQFPRLALETLTILVALALTALAWRKVPRGHIAFISVAPLWVGWLLASPYGHFFDEIILAVPVVAYLTQNGRDVGRLLPATSLYLLLFSLLLLTLTPFHAYLLSLPLLAIAIFMLMSKDDPRFRSDSQPDELRTNPAP
jgi:hypothetical protein